MQFQTIATTLDQLLSPASEFLEPIEYLTLTDLVTCPPMFCILVRAVFDLEEMEILEIDNIYAEFCTFVHQSQPAFANLRSVLDIFNRRKRRSRTLKQATQTVNFTLEVHRLEYVPEHKAFEQRIKDKKIVIDNDNDTRFPHDMYHHIHTETAYIIKPVGDRPQVHILVLQTADTPVNDDDIKNIWMENRTGGTVPPDFEKWYAGAQMFNVFNGNLLLRNELSSLADMITKQISNRKAVKRSTPSDGKMAGLGPTVWVTGNAVNRQHWNWKNTDMQQELLTDAEETIEAWISVCTLSIK